MINIIKKSPKKYQTGVSLFFSLIALLVLSLAAAALIRSVDTNALIAGNVAFQQSANNSTDAGVEAAITAIATMRDDGANVGKNVIQNAANTLNVTDLANNPGYFSSLTAALTTEAQLTADATWDGTNPNNYVTLPADRSGNVVQYMIQRMCRFPNVAIKDADCLLSQADADGEGIGIKLNPEVCDGDSCPSGGQTPLVRVTIKVTGPRNTVAFAQAFIH